MAGFCLNYCLFISVAGCVLLVFFAFCCFVNLEALRLPKDSKNSRGFAVLFSAILYGGIVALLIYKKKEEENQVARNPYQYNISADEELKTKLID